MCLKFFHVIFLTQIFADGLSWKGPKQESLATFGILEGSVL